MIKIKFTLLLLLSLSCLISRAQSDGGFAGSQADRDSLAKTSIYIREAFSNGDVNRIMQFHHPEVIKALGYKNYQVGAAAVRAGIAGTLAGYRLEFIGNDQESLIINGNTAIEQTLFTIRGTPKGNGAPFVFKGRSIIVYVRYAQSPTGWATIREQIQPATD